MCAKSDRLITYRLTLKEHYSLTNTAKALGTCCYYFYVTHFMWNMLSFCVTFYSHDIKDIDFKLSALVQPV